MELVAGQRRSLTSDAMVVLLVEDEPLVRMFAVDVLEDEGFTVIEAKNTDEALKQLREHTDVQVMVTDVHMPGSLDGLALAREAATIYPLLAVLSVSGKGAPSAEDMPVRAHFLPKPYFGRTVIEHIRAAVNAA